MSKSRHYPAPPRVEPGVVPWTSTSYRRYLKAKGKDRAAKACPYVLEEVAANRLRMRQRISWRGVFEYSCTTRDCNCCCYYDFNGSVTNRHSSRRPDSHDPLWDAYIGQGCARSVYLHPHENPEGRGWRQVIDEHGTRWVCPICVKRPPAKPTLHKATRKKGR